VKLFTELSAYYYNRDTKEWTRKNEKKSFKTFSSKCHLLRDNNLHGFHILLYVAATYGASLKFKKIVSDSCFWSVENKSQMHLLLLALYSKPSPP
jgi:hypothetical protein